MYSFPRLIFHGRGDEREKRFDLVLMRPLTDGNSFECPDWVFVFRTSEVIIKDHPELSPTRVEIEVYHSRDIPLFYDSESYGSIFKGGKFIYKGGDLRINESVVIKEVKDEYQTRYFACLENQMCYRRNNLEARYIGDINILIGSSNKNIHNMGMFEYSLLFQAGIDLQVAIDKEENFRQTAFNLEMLINNEKTVENKELLEGALVLVNKEIDELEKMERKVFDAYLTHLKNLDNR